jgi:biotin carboxyl carrier protein
MPNDARDVQVRVHEGRPSDSSVTRLLIESEGPAALRLLGARAGKAWRLRAAGGGPPVDVLLSETSLHVWRDSAHLALQLETNAAQAMVRGSAGSLMSTLPGVVVSVLVSEGERVSAGQALLVIEAMKMEHTLRAPQAGVVKVLKHRVGDRVKEGSALVEVEPSDSAAPAAKVARP